MLQDKTILWVDDTVFDLAPFVGALYAEGANVIHAENLVDAKLELEKTRIDLAILDIRIPLGTNSNLFLKEFDIVAAKGGFEAGIVLAQWIKKNYPGLLIMGFSINDYSTESVRWFFDQGNGYLQKTASLRISEFVSYIRRIVKGEGERKRLKTFIVHGQDEKSKYELKNYLQNVLKLEEPIILHEQPSIGRTVIEKFEEIATDVDLVFVLLTPDDLLYFPRTSNEVRSRARQNVIFELGYFFAKLQRRKGKVILLHKGEVELPSDIFGIIFIDITKGIEAAGEIIRKEISDLL